jgi:hypothetical protein
MAGVLLDELADAGAKARELVLPGSDWVHRRVQRVSYLEPSLVVVKLSVDFTPPTTGIGSHLPISVLPKWPPLYRFDYRDGAGEPVPLLTSEQNGVADRALLEALVKDVSPTSLSDEKFHKAMVNLTEGPETHLAQSFDTFRGKLGGVAGDPRRERVLEIAALLPDATLLWWPVAEGGVGQRTVCKVDYLIRSVETEKRGVKVLRSLSWRQPPEFIPLWHLGADANFHAEVEAPEVLRIRSVETKFYRFNRSASTTPAVPAPPSGGAPKGKVPLQDHIDREGRLTHVYVAGQRPLAGDLVVTFAPAVAVVASTFGASVLIALLTSAFYAFREQMAPADHIDAAVSVLILVPALIGYVVVRPNDPPLARRYILGTQLLSLLAGAVPLVMAVLLLRFATEPSCLTAAWLSCAVISWLIAAALGFSLAKALDGKG